MEIHGLADIWLDYRHNKFHWNNFIGLSLGVLKSSYGNSGIWLKNDDRIGISLGHISNANIGNKNPGVEIISLSYQKPF